MSLLTALIGKSLVPALEDEFIAHEPDARKLLLSEAIQLSDSLVTWISSKISQHSTIAQTHGSRE